MPYRQVGKEVIKALQPELVEVSIAVIKETRVKLFGKFDRELFQCLRVELVRVEVERQDALDEHTVKPEGGLFGEHDLKYFRQDFCRVWFVDESTVSLMIRD